MLLNVHDSIAGDVRVVGRRAPPGLIRPVSARSSPATAPAASFYGSDWPMSDPAAEIAAIRALGLPPEDEAAILGDNLATLPGLLPRLSPPRLSA